MNFGSDHGTGFGSFSATPWLGEVSVKGPVPAIALQHAATARVAYYAPVVAKRRKLQLHMLDCVGDDLRAVALHKWLSVVECNLKASEVGRHVLRLHESPEELVAFKGLFDDVTATKATATLSLSVNALLAFWKWFMTTGDTGVRPLPVLESRMYDYCKVLDRDGKSASKASSSLRAWMLAVFVLGFEDPTLEATSLRCSGSALKQFLKKRILRSRNSLHTFALACLVIAACHIEDALLRAAAGFLCLCTYGRLRCSDGNRLFPSWSSWLAKSPKPVDAEELSLLLTWIL
jgi:hypothetical protein